MSETELSAIEIEARLKERQRRTMDSEECEGIHKSSKILVITMIVICLIITSGFIMIFAYSSSAILRIKYDFSDIDVTPEHNIQLDITSTYLDYSKNITPTEAIYTPFMIFVGLLYPAVDQFFHDEKYMIQMPNRTVSQLLIDYKEFLDGYTDYFFATYVHFIDLDNPNEFVVRLSADYRVLVKIFVNVDFIAPEKEDKIISFIYIEDQTLSSVGIPLGICTFDLYNALTTTFTIDNLNYASYTDIHKFYTQFGDELDLHSYPYTIVGSRTNSFNLMDYIRAD